jgi:hypothetical protein
MHLDLKAGPLCPLTHTVKYNVCYRSTYRLNHKSLGISDLCGAVVGMVTPKGCMSTEGEALQVSVLSYSCSICPLLHRHNWLSFGKFQDTERFLIPCPHHVSSRLPPSGETCKYATVPNTRNTWRDSLHIDVFLFAVSVLVVARPSSQKPEGLMNFSLCKNVDENLKEVLKNFVENV